jgi:hypothetical protein
MIELQILKSFLTKNTWVEYRKYINKKDLTKELTTLFDILDSHHANFDNDLTESEFEVICEMSHKCDKTHKEVLTTMTACHVRPELVGDLLTAYKQKNVLSRLALAAYDASEGRKSLDTVNTLINELNDPNAVVKVEENNFATENLEELYITTYAKPGLRWRLDTLNKSLGSLRMGDFGFIFARPETGKTTFLASELTHMATQATRPILWINNEEQSNKVMLRCYQALLGLTDIELFSDIPRAQAEYTKLIQGRLRIFNGVTASASQIEKLCKDINPELIVFDQIDKIGGFNNDREDLRLGAIYQWARELAKLYGPVIGVTQADGSGDNQRWLNMNNIANAKTSKQAEADWILGIGKVHDIGLEYIRFLNLCKNKLQGDPDTNPELRHGRLEVLITPSIARYEDLTHSD